MRCCKDVLTGEDNPNHRHVASAHSRSQLWDAETSQQVAVMCSHDKEVLSAAFSPSGRGVTTASNDSTARLWDVGAIPKGDLFAIACAWLPDYDFWPHQPQSDLSGGAAAVWWPMEFWGFAVTATRVPAALQITRRAALSAIWGTCVAASRLHPVMAQAPAKVRIQLDQQALNAIPGDERVGLDVREDTSLAAQALKAHSPPGKALPIIYLIAGNLSLPSIRSAVQEMLRRREYGGVVIDTRASPADIRNDPAAQADTLLVIRADGSTASVRATLVTEDFLKGALDYHGQ